MSDPITLGPWLRRFLCEHIVTERNLSQNTRKSYRDTFSLLLPFISGKLRKPVDRLAACRTGFGKLTAIAAPCGGLRRQPSRRWMNRTSGGF